MVLHSYLWKILDWRIYRQNDTMPGICIVLYWEVREYKLNKTEQLMISNCYNSQQLHVHAAIWKSHGWRSLVGCSPWGRKSQTRLSDFTFPFPFHALEKEMATHSSVLAWRIPGTGEPGGLPSMGSHGVRHDWSDLAAVAAAICINICEYVNEYITLYFTV